MENFDVRKWLATRGRDETRVEFTQPRKLTCWTKASVLDGGHFLFGDRSGLPPFSTPQLPADLSAGYPDAFVRKDASAASPVDTILQAAAAAEAAEAAAAQAAAAAADAAQQGATVVAAAAAAAPAPAAPGGAVRWRRASVVTYRNNLNKILMTPLAGRDEWVVDAAWVSGALVLDIVKTDGWQQSEACGPGTRQDKFMYWGYHFEALCTGGGAGAPVDSSSEYGVVVTYRLGQHRLLMAAEIDCYDPEACSGDTPGCEAHLELKTYRVPTSRQNEATIYRLKHPRWWLQSFLGGVPQLVLGGRNDEGQLIRVVKQDVARLPELSARAGQPWAPNTLLRFGDDCLAYMARCAQAAAGKQLRFRYDPALQQVSCSAVEGGDMAARLLPLMEIPGEGGGGLDGGRGG